jgi:formate hydrogenlyase regulatory protein HycA
MAFVVASMPLEGLRLSDAGWQKHKQWHAVLHTFDSRGRHLNTDVWTAGTTADGEARVIEQARDRLSQMLASLGPVKYCDVKVSLFRVEIEGREFGLIDASEPDEGYESIHLLPNDLAFFEPWDGTYDT